MPDVPSGRSNANVVRWLGHAHIPQRFAPQVDAAAQRVLSPAVDYHRPCMFAVAHVDAQGRVTCLRRLTALAASGLTARLT